MTSAEGTGAGAAAAVEGAVNAVVDPLSTALSTAVFVELPLPGGTGVPVVVLWLVAAAVAMTAYFGFIQFRGVKAALQLVRGRYSHPDDPGRCRTSTPSRPPCRGRWGSATSPVSAWR